MKLGLIWLLCGICWSASAASLVQAEDYDAFWLWGGVKPQALLRHARSVYVLQGEIAARSGQGRAEGIRAQGVALYPPHSQQLWLVYRAQTLDWSPQVTTQITAQLRRWRQAGHQVLGIQIDFDAYTRHLQDYAQFLRQLRRALPRDCQLSITGLLDWASNADPAALNALKGVVDELVVQTYQGRYTVPDYQRYLSRVRRLALPFKIGLIQGGEWRPPAGLAQQPWFRGYVVFLQNPSPTR